MRTADETKMQMFVVYSYPSDYPNKFVVRRWWIGGGPAPDQDWFFLGDSLEEVRGHIPPFCVRIERDPRDEPQIVECWV